MPELRARPLGPGDRAPGFTLADHDGNLVSLASVLEKGPVVVFFYPKDETPGCTREACSFRDAYDEFQAVGASVLGISSDSAGAHRKFRERHGFPFLLLADEGGRVREEWAVPKTLGILDGRSTYVIDRGGVVRHVFHSQLQVKKHVSEALDVVKRL